MIAGVVLGSSILVAVGGIWLAGGIPERATSPAALLGTGEQESDSRTAVGVITAAGQEAFVRGEFAEAQSKFLEAARLEPDNPWLAFNLGAVAGALGDLKGASGFYQRAIELDSDSAPAYYNLGYTLALLGDSGGAVSAYTRAIELQPENASALWNLGLLLYDQGETTEARDLLRQAAALDDSLLLRLPESVTLQ